MDICFRRIFVGTKNRLMISFLSELFRVGLILVSCLGRFVVVCDFSVWFQFGRHPLCASNVCVLLLFRYHNYFARIIYM